MACDGNYCGKVRVKYKMYFCFNSIDNSHDAYSSTYILCSRFKKQPRNNAFNPSLISNTYREMYISICTYQREEEEEGGGGNRESQRSHVLYSLCRERWVSSSFSSSNFDLPLEKWATSYKNNSIDLRSQWSMNSHLSL